MTVYAAKLVATGTFNPMAGYAEMVLGECWNTGWFDLVTAEIYEEWNEATEEDLESIRLVGVLGVIYHDGNGGFFAAWEV